MVKRLVVMGAVASAVWVSAAWSAYGAVYTPPWAHLNAIPLTYKLTWGEGWLDQSGYDCYPSTNLSAYAWYTHMKSDALFISCGHGGPGFIEANGGSHIFGKGGTNAWPSYFISNMSSSDIADLKLFMAMGCSTVQTDPTYGNLLDEARAKGADIAIGWQDTIYADSASVFGMGFVRGVWDRNLRVDYPLGVGSGQDDDLMQYAFSYMSANSADAAWKKNQLYWWVTKGMYGHSLLPARYGEL